MRNTKPKLNVAEMLLIACGFGIHAAQLRMPRGRHNHGIYTPHQNEREMARRRRQLAAGQLDESASIKCLNRISERLGA